MYNLTFVNLKNFVLLYFWIPVSGFRFDFQIPGVRVAPFYKAEETILTIIAQLS